MASTTRMFPLKNFGSIPELDGHIQRGPFEGRKEQFKVGSKYLPNLTDARLEAADQHGLKEKYPVATIARKRQWAKRKQSPTTSAANKLTKKREPGASETHQKQKRPYVRRQLNGNDIYNSASRIFVRMPDNTELSLPQNISEKAMVTTLRALTKVKRTT